MTVRLSDLLAVDRIAVPVAAGSLEAVARELLERLVDAGVVADPQALRERIDEDRPEDIVAMGDRAFLLHYRTEAVTELSVALGIAREPICRQLGEGEAQCARIMLLVTSPPRDAARYLQIVGAFARILSSVERVDALLAEPTAAAVAAFPEFRSHELPEQLTVREMMNDRPITTAPDALLRDAAREMVRTRVSALPVVDGDGRLLGMLSSRDLVRDLLGTYLQGGATRQTPTHGAGRAAAAGSRRTVREVMTRQVLCVSPDQPLAEVASLMSNKDVERVPVVRDGRLVGFLTRGDIVRRLIGS
jgi:CBS domain-containing protein/mannitol/fructose-specific phosphotransferase system IIA component (Ntr-type)